MRFIICIALLVVATVFSTEVRAEVNPQEGRGSINEQLDAAKSMFMVDPRGALNVALGLEDVLGSPRPGTQEAETYASVMRIKGEALNRLNRPQEAIASLDYGLSLFPGDAQSIAYADLQSARASSARAMGDYAGALSRLQAAYKIYVRSGEARSAYVGLLRIGQVYDDARNYEKALYYYLSPSDSFSKDDSLNLSNFNNIGKVYLELGRLDESFSYFSRALEIAERMDSSTLRERILTNLALVHLARGKLDEARRVVAEGLSLAEANRDKQWRPALLGIRAKIAFLEDDLFLSRKFIEEAFLGQDIGSTSALFRDFHQVAFEIYSRSGDFRSAFEHLVAFKRLDDEAREVSANANTALMGAQFDFANQELEISKLKTDTLEKEVQLARTRAQQRTIIFSAAILLVLVGVTGGSIHYRSVVRSRNEIRKKNDELSQSNLFLEKALKAKSEFLATTSHEIRTPLNGILGTTQVLIHSARMPEEVRERVELIQIAGEAMKGIVDDLLDVAKMESGTIEVADECFNLQTALSEVSRFWADSAANKGLILAADLEASPSFVMGDEKRLRQIVYNLLSNAVKFTDEGRVTLRAEVDAESDGTLVIKVADTGCGIPEDELDRIFAPFHQVDGGKTRRHGGTGLGLSICQNLAAALGGTVSVSSRLGEGSTFVLRLPLRLAEAAGRSLVGAIGDTSSGLTLSRLLIASDDAGVSASLQIPLAMRDVDFELVDSMAEAVSAMADRPVSGLLVVASVLGSDPGEAMERLMEFRELSGEARLIVWLDEASLLTAPMVRLCGADDVIEGDFDPEGALACVLNEPPLATEYQGIDVRPSGSTGP